jgi:hypothetical protein
MKNIKCIIIIKDFTIFRSAMEQPLKAKDHPNAAHPIHFNLTTRDLQCFISERAQSKSTHKRLPKGKPFLRVLQ